MVLAHHYNIRGAKSKPDEGPIALGRMVKIPLKQTKNRLAPARLSFGTHELFAFALFSFQRTRLTYKSVSGSCFRAALRELGMGSHAEHSSTPPRVGQAPVFNRQKPYSQCPAWRSRGLCAYSLHTMYTSAVSVGFTSDPHGLDIEKFGSGTPFGYIAIGAASIIRSAGLTKTPAMTVR